MKPDALTITRLMLAELGAIGARVIMAAMRETVEAETGRVYRWAWDLHREVIRLEPVEMAT